MLRLIRKYKRLLSIVRRQLKSFCSKGRGRKACVVMYLKINTVASDQKMGEGVKE
jgi:hypothetical protein